MILRSYLVGVRIALLCFAVAGPAYAATVSTIGSGSAVTSIDRSVTFNELDFAGRETPLSDYRSGGLYVRTNGNSYYGDDARGKVLTIGTPFNPFHLSIAPDHSYVDVGGGFYFPYEAGPGNFDWVTIQTTDGRKIYGLEFLYGNGWTTGDIWGAYPWGNSSAYLEWKTLVGGAIVSSGQIGTTEFLEVGSVVGFRDPEGFDQLMVRAPHPTPIDPNMQELALDNLKVALSPGNPVPVSPQVSMPTQEILFPHFAIGGGWESDLTIVAQGGTASSGSVVFYTQTGQLMTVTVNGNPVNGRQDFTLSLRSSITYKLTGGPQTQVGWIIVSEIQSDTTSKGSITGLLTFRYRVGSTVMSQVGVAAARELQDAHLVYDNTGGNETTLAVCSVASNTLQINRYNAQGNLQEQKQVNFTQLSQQALYVREMFPNSANTSGFLTISGAQYFGLLALNSNGSQWSGSVGLPAVYERQLEIRQFTRRAFEIDIGGTVYPWPAGNEPRSYQPRHRSDYLSSFRRDAAVSQYEFIPCEPATVMTVATARISDLNFQDILGTVTHVNEDGTIQVGGSFHLYALPSAQF